jgi:hypothetical protein
MISGMSAIGSPKSRVRSAARRVAYHIISGPHHPSSALPGAGTGPVIHRHAGTGHPITLSLGLNGKISS